MLKSISKKEKLEQLHKKMIDEIQDFAIILLDVDGTILSWNKGAEAIKGYKEDEIIGENFRLFYLPEDREAGLPEKILETARIEGRAHYIGRRLKKNGIIFWGSMTLTALHDESNRVIGFTKLTRELNHNTLLQ